MIGSRPRNVLIIRQDRLGDVVLGTALPREIRRQWPDARVSVLLRPYSEAVFEANPHVDEILRDEPSVDSVGERAEFWALVRELRRRRFSHALILLPSKRYSYACFCAGIPVRIGVGAIFHQLITGMRFVMRHKYRDHRHEADYSLDLARKIGIRGGDYTPEIHLSPDEASRRDGVRAQWGQGRPLLGVHVGSGRSAPNWPPLVYREFITRLVSRGDLQLVVTDHEVPAEVAGLPEVLYPNRGLALREAIVNFAALDQLVSASTGPMHVCGALGVRTVSLFCPLPACAPERWRPLGNRATVVMPDEGYCQQHCPGDPHDCQFHGPGGISIDRVLGTAVQRLAHE